MLLQKIRKEKKKAIIVDMVEIYYRDANDKLYNDLIEGLNTYDIDIIKNKLYVLNNDLMKDYLMNYLNEISE